MDWEMFRSWIGKYLDNGLGNIQILDCEIFRYWIGKYLDNRLRNIQILDWEIFRYRIGKYLDFDLVFCIQKLCKTIEAKSYIKIYHLRYINHKFFYIFSLSTANKGTQVYVYFVLYIEYTVHYYYNYYKDYSHTKI